MRSSNTALAVILVAIVAFSACISGASKGDVAAEKADSTVDANAGSDALALGSIEGMVRTDEQLPIPDVKVAILNTDLEVATDASGRFAILNLAPGEYTVIAQKLGYESSGVRTRVEAGNVSTVAMTLVPLPTEEAFYVTSRHTATLQCMLVTAAWVSSCSYPYTAVYLGAKGAGVNLSTYGVPADIMTNKWRYNYTVDFGVMGVVSELTWAAQTELAKTMWLHQCTPDYDPILDTCERGFANVHALNPIIMPWKVPKDYAPKEPGKVAWIMSAVWPYPNDTTSVGIYLDQKVDMYNSAFYFAEPPEDWSILPAK